MDSRVSPGGAGTPPTGAMFGDPVDQRRLEPDVVTDLLGFDPLVLQDLFLFGKELPVQR